MSLDEGHRAEPPAEVRTKTEHGAGVRVTEIGGFGSDDNLPSADRSERQLFERRAAASTSARNPSAKAAAGGEGRALRLCRAEILGLSRVEGGLPTNTDGRRSGRGKSRLQQAST
jgi:hypothetical protein